MCNRYLYSDALLAKRNNTLEDNVVKEIPDCFDYVIKYKNIQRESVIIKW